MEHSPRWTLWAAKPFSGQILTQSLRYCYVSTALPTVGSYGISTYEKPALFSGQVLTKSGFIPTVGSCGISTYEKPALTGTEGGLSARGEEKGHLRFQIHLVRPPDQIRSNKWEASHLS